MKKFLIVAILASAFVLTGCGSKKVDMNVLDKDNKFHYANETYKFSVALPESFLYYQTQSKKNDDFAVIEFYVPTADQNYPQAVPGYARAIDVRIYDDAKKWESADKTILVEAAKKDNRIYALKFWDTVPSDWGKKWSNDMKTDIKNDFKAQ